MPRILVIDGPDQGKEFLLDELDEGSHLVGRDPRHPIAIADSTVSREHFRLERLARGFRVIDLGSRNRTFINGEPVREGVLRNGDVIAIGDSEMRFEDDAEDVEVTGMASTIIKEFSSLEKSSIERIIDSLRSDPGLRKGRIASAVESLRRLFQISQEMLKSASVDDLYQKFLEILVPALQADRAAVLVRDSEHAAWTPLACVSAADIALRQNTDSTRPSAKRPGGDDSKVDGARGLLVSETVVRSVADECKAILSKNAGEDFGNGESIVAAKIATVIAAPIRAPVAGQKDLLGILYADRRGSKPAFTEDELHFLSAAGDQAGAVVYHIRSNSELREERRTLLRTLTSARPIIGRSKAIDELLAFVRKAAPTSMTVLIRGETGTGKDLVASAIHYQSPRQGKPFIALNCAALPENLIESELFGYEKGAFTSATSRKKGRFELAHGGTIFLDEIAELSPGCQAKLLRLLEERRFERVGGTESIEVDVRILAATNIELGQAIEEGRFREDLFYRLNVLTVTLPSLRERSEDIPELARFFLREMGATSDLDAILSPAAERVLLEYHWPGNVRQLRNVIESAVVLKDGPKIEPEDLMLREAPRSGRRKDPDAESEPWTPESLEEVQKRHILRVLDHTGGNKKRASEILGIERCTLYAKLKSFGIAVKSRSAATD